MGIPIDLKDGEGRSMLTYVCIYGPPAKRCAVSDNITGYLWGSLDDKLKDAVEERAKLCPECVYKAAMSLGYGGLK